MPPQCGAANPGCSRLSRRLLIATLLLLASPIAPAQIRIRGHRGIDNIVQAWEAAYHQNHANTTFDNQLRGNASAIGQVYTGAADIALMSREIWPIEIEGYDQALGAKPVPIAIAKATSLAIFVHKNNPLSQLSVVQLDAIFGADHRRGPTRIKTWSQLGGANQPINLYGYAIERHFSQFFEQAVFLGSRKWNCNLHEIPTGKEILDALSKDPNGIAIANQTDQNPQTKPVALLPRHLWIIVAHPINPKVKVFVDYLLSAEGQQVISSAGGYLPLSAVQ